MVAWRLKALVDSPAEVDGCLMALRYTLNHYGGKFHVKSPWA